MIRSALVESPLLVPLYVWIPLVDAADALVPVHVYSPIMFLILFREYDSSSVGDSHAPYPLPLLIANCRVDWYGTVSPSCGTEIKALLIPINSLQHRLEGHGWPDRTGQKSNAEHCIPTRVDAAFRSLVYWVVAEGFIIHKLIVYRN